MTDQDQLDAPRTEAGRRLATSLGYPNGTDDPHSTWHIGAIVAIEDEARDAAVRERDEAANDVRYWYDRCAAAEIVRDALMEAALDVLLQQGTYKGDKLLAVVPFDALDDLRAALHREDGA